MSDWPTVARDFERYLLTSQKAPGTAKTYAYNVAPFYDWCLKHECRAHDVAKEWVRAWIEERLEIVSSARAHNDLAALKWFYRWVRDELRMRDDDPTEGVAVKRRESLPTEPLTEAELRILVDNCDSERDRLILLVMAHTGVRIAELASMKAEGINWRDGTIRVIGKGDKERKVYPHADIFGRLHAFVGMFPAGPIWLSKFKRPLSAHEIRKIIYKIAERAQVDGVHPHRFRAFFATEFLDEDGDIHALQTMLGHRSLETTAGYAHARQERAAQQKMKNFRRAG